MKETLTTTRIISGETPAVAKKQRGLPALS